MPMSPESAASTERAIRDAERELTDLQRDLEETDKKIKRLVLRGNDSAAVAAQLKRDDLARRVIRVQLRQQGLRDRLGMEQEAAKAARRQQLEAEAAELEADIAALDARGEEMARAMTPVCHEIERKRGRAMELSTKLTKGQLIPVGPEPVRSYQAVCGVLNSLRRSCTFTKTSHVTESQLLLPEDDHHGQAAAE